MALNLALNLSSLSSYGALRGYTYYILINSLSMLLAPVYSPHSLRREAEACSFPAGILYRHWLLKVFPATRKDQRTERVRVLTLGRRHGTSQVCR